MNLDRLIVLPETSPVKFPDPDITMKQPEGLLCVGGNLKHETLYNAYLNGIFPWFSEGQPILWWSPETRAVFNADKLHISKNMRKLYRQQKYEIVFDYDTNAVIERCSKREDGASTWITQDVIEAYSALARSNLVHSVEVYEGATLVGGLYGVFVKNIFCGESMFSARPNTSKLALFELANLLLTHGCNVIDCQLVNEHLLSLGAFPMPRNEFLSMLNKMTENHTLTNRSWANLPYKRQVEL